ncbi:MAG: DUF6259 domain-containing protein [Planctomycetia bacterium]|nr:DUF6259 domain-containing protein [Planctomycetia bacterium]
MKKGLFVVLLGLTAALYAESPNLELKSETARLVWNADGLSITPHQGSPAVQGCSRPVWSLCLLENPANADYTGKTIVLDDNVQKLEQQRNADGSYEIFYPEMVQGEKKFAVSVRLKLAVVNGAFDVSAEVANNTTDWVVQELTGPVLVGIQADIEKTPLLWPSGLGQKFSLPPNVTPPVNDTMWGQKWREENGDYVKSAQYPSHPFTMQWVAFAGDTCGLSIASHDPTRESKRFTVRYQTAAKTYKVSIVHQPMIAPNTVWTKNLLHVLPYRGSWHVAARHYRDWVDTWNTVGQQKPDWVKELSGMLLVILKQQNGRYVMWHYDDIGGKMCDVADAMGYDFIALFGWHHGGHDHLYPEYFPAEEMGGREALRKGIAAAHARGKRVYMYANGQLIDSDNKAFWEKEGKALSMVRKDGGLYSETWQKFEDSPSHYCGLACSGNPRWFEIMLGLAKQANDLGADGILYDQLGVGASVPCFAPNHGHPVPSMGHGTQAAYLLKKLQEAMSQINPNFIILTEGLNDAGANAVSYYHGMCFGAFGPPSVPLLEAMRKNALGTVRFPELYRYTYPEVTLTIRNPSPVEHPRFTNYACLYGINHEVELRYPPDVKCVETGKLPTTQEYVACRSCDKLHFGHFDREASECFAYSKAVIAFQKANADLLVRGKFVDTDGFTCEGPVLAKAFCSEDGKKLGVVLWNPNPEPATFRLEVPGKRCVASSAPNLPQVAEPFAPMEPESMRLVVFAP